MPIAPAATGAGGCVLEGDIPAARVHDLEQQLPTLTSGEGALETVFDHWSPVEGVIPVRPRSGPDPLDRREYLLQVQRRLGLTPSRPPAGRA